MTDNQLQSIEITDEFMREVDCDYIAKMILKYGKNHFILVGERMDIYIALKAIYKHNKDFLFQLVDTGSTYGAWTFLLDIDKDGEFIDYIDFYNTDALFNFAITCVTHANQPQCHVSDYLITKVLRLVKTSKLGPTSLYTESTRQHIIHKLEYTRTQHSSV